jgi:hypothetical protein
MLTRIERANALPETALVLGLAVTVLYGVVQMALLGFTQISADGAAFVGAHETVAKYGGPTSSNFPYTTTAAKAVFPHLGATFAPSIPANGAYETDVTTVAPAVLTGIFGPTTAKARTIEPSTSIANTGTPLGACATGAINLTGNVVNGTLTKTVGLLQSTTTGASQIINVGQDVNGNTAVILNPTSSVLGAHVQLYQTIGTQLQIVSGVLNTLSGLLSTARLGGLLGALIDPLTTSLNTVIQTAVQDALAGVPTATLQTDLSNITTTLNNTATANPLNLTLQTLLNALLTPITTVLDPALTAIDNATQTLVGLDKNAPGGC